MLISALLVEFAFNSAVFAQEGIEQVQEDEITVYATRSQQPAFDVPAVVSRVNTDEPGDALAGDFSNLLEFIPGVEVQGGPRAVAQRLTIRGFDDDSVLQLLDGRRQNFRSTHDGRVFIDSNLIKSIEVVKGPTSAIYGGGALGGVIAFETKDAADLLEPGRKIGAISSFFYRSSRSEVSPVFSAFAREGGWDFLGSASYRNSGDIRQGDGNKLSTKDEPLSLMFKAGYTFLDFHTLKFHGNMKNNQGQWPNNPSAAVSSGNPIVNQDVRDNQFSLKYSFSNPDNPWMSPKLHIYRNETEVKEEDISGSNAGRVQTREIETTGFTADSQTRFELTGTDNHTFSYGFEIYKDEQDASRSTNASRIRDGVPRAEDLNYGVYAQHEAGVDSPIGEFIGVAAVRYDKYRNEVSEGCAYNHDGNASTPDIACPERDKSEVSPKFALTYKPVDEVMIFGSWARAFRAPHLNEIYSSGQHFPGGFPIAFVNVLRPVIVRGRPVTDPTTGMPQMEVVTRPVIDPDTMAPVIDHMTGMPQTENVTRPVIAGDNLFVTNPNLKPETVDTFEIGAGVNFDSFLLKGSWFYSKGDDFISTEVTDNIVERNELGGLASYTPWVTRITNVPNAVLKGFDLEGTYRFRQLKLKTALSYVEAKNDDTGEYLDNSVPLTFTSDLSLLISGIDSVAGFRSRVAGNNDKQPNGATRTEGYAVFDVYYRWAPDSGRFQNMTFDLGIENIFDKAYTKRFASLKEDGFSFTGKVSYKW